MHPDRKIGIAMGILLVGVVAALFFRNEPLPVDDSLSVRRENELNERLRERDVAVYMDTKQHAVSDTDEPQWTLSESLSRGKLSDEALPISLKSEGSEQVVREVPPSPAAVLPVRDKPEEKSKSVTHKHNRTADTDRESEITDASDDPGEDHNTIGVSEPPESYKEYQIQYGDTLSGISQRFLGSHQRYSEIYDANKDRIDNPDRLRVGTAIRIPRAFH